MSLIRLAWLATHPTQYQAPLLRSIAKCPDIDLEVLYFSDFSSRGFIDSGFGRHVEWDVPLMEGYKYEILSKSSSVQNITTFNPRVQGLKKRLTKDNYDAILVQGWQHYGMVLAAYLARQAGLKVLMRCEATDHVDSSTGAKRLLRESVVSFLLKQVNFCLAIGTHNKNFYVSRGFPKERIGFMPYAVDNEIFSSRAKSSDLNDLRMQLNLNVDLPVLLFVGKFTKRKKPDYLLAAYAALPEPRPYLIFVGDGELRPLLEEFALDKKLENVRFAGFRNQNELPPFYALADIFVLPSTNETWGLVVNEAMNAGCALVVTNQVGSAADLVREGRNGFSVDGDNVLELSGALSKCLANERFRDLGIESINIIHGWGIEENVEGLRAVLIS
jgi:glycosyltransferase involved in cell wall biosynthesis